ncbi:MAG: septum formation initiator family protein [Bacteroidaceae bacterium]|jgi:cell division protein FtsB|nr:septum formation initiator family protein [Bacteroidaceae bacterium]
MSKIHSAWLFMCRHKYILTVIIIGLIVGVVDEDSFLNRHPRKVRIEMLQQEIANYKRQYTEADNKIHELQTNPKAVEKIARERYYMKRANEDVFVFENNETEQLDD